MLCASIRTTGAVSGGRAGSRPGHPSSSGTQCRDVPEVKALAGGRMARSGSVTGGTEGSARPAYRPIALARSDASQELRDLRRPNGAGGRSRRASGAVWVMVLDAEPEQREASCALDARHVARARRRVLSPSVAGGGSSANFAGNAVAIGERLRSGGAAATQASSGRLIRGRQNSRRRLESHRQSESFGAKAGRTAITAGPATVCGWLSEWLRSCSMVGPRGVQLEASDHVNLVIVC